MPFGRDGSQVAQAQPADVGFGYINDDSSREPVNMPMTPKSPLKSAMKVPGTPGRKFENPLSPTFMEEEILEKREKDTEKEQVRDLVSHATIEYIHESELTHSIGSQDKSTNG